MPEMESLSSTDEPLRQRMQRHAFDRLIMLSDGVFAIAITLAALEIRIPGGEYADLTAVLRALAGPVITYVVSFAVIAVYWLAHRRNMALIRRVDMPFTLLNLLLLAFVALQPAGVELLTRIGRTDAAVDIYLCLIIALGLAQSALWGYASFIGKLVDPEVSTRYRSIQLIAGLVLPVVTSLITIYSSRSGSPWLVLAAILAIVAMGAVRRRFTPRPYV